MNFKTGVLAFFLAYVAFKIFLFLVIPRVFLRHKTSMQGSCFLHNFVKIKSSLLCLIFFVVSNFNVVLGQTKEQQRIEKKMKELVQNGSILLGSPEKKILFEFNSKERFVPASVLKIAITAAAFDILGKNFRFNTTFYTNKKKELLIQGGGDPFLISEEITKIARLLKKKGYTRFSALKLDDSLIITKKVPGLSKSKNAYDALNGALVVNFNSLFLEKKKNGEIVSAEEWTPLTALAKEKGNFLVAGKKDRINVGDSYADSLRYTAELFIAIFQKEGIRITQDSYKKASLNENWSLILNYKNSRDLKELIPSFLLYSNNYIANQIYFRIGGEKYGRVYNLEKSNRAMTLYMAQFGANSKNFQILEGSGLSRDNRITGQIILNILYKISSDYRLFPQEKKIYLKTGTLQGVYNLAGYIPYQGQNYPFCILINAPKNNRFQVLEMLKKWLELDKTG